MNIKEIISKYNIKDIQVSASYLPMTQTLVFNKKVSGLFPAYDEFTLWNDIIKPGCFRDTTRTAIVVYQTASGELMVQSRESAKRTYAQLCQEFMLYRFCHRPPDYSAEVTRMLTSRSYPHTSPRYCEYGVAIKKVTSMSDVLNFDTYTRDLHLFLYTLDGGLVYSGPMQGVQRLMDMDKHKALISVILKPYNDGYKWTYVLMLREDQYDFCDIKNRLEKWIPDMPSFSPSIPVFAPQR